MKILVTGGAGFIGHHLVQALVQRGDDVIVLDNLSTGKKDRLPESVILIQADVLAISKQDFPEDIDAIIHLAAQIDVSVSENNPVHDAEQNILGTIAVLDFAKQNGIKKVIFASSAAVYGDTKKLPVSEEMPKQAKVAYGVSKRGAELYLELYAERYGIETVSLRYANVYGPGQDGSKESGVIAVFCRKLKENQSLTINGDGSITRDFIFVEDIARANIAALAPGITGVLNVSTQTETSLKELVHTLEQVSGTSLEVVYGQEKAGDIKHSCLQNTEALRLLDWKPQVDLATGLRKTLEA